jgi:hypothetical protein
VDRRAGAPGRGGGRADPADVKVMCCAPAHISDDIADSCEQVRWFRRWSPTTSSTSCQARRRRPASRTHRVRLPDEAGGLRLLRAQPRRGEARRADHGRDLPALLHPRPAEAHIEKLRRLEAAGVDQWNIYLMTHGQEETLATYGEQIIPALAAEAVPPASG